MKISIITVAFNSEKTIRDTIESVLSQDYEDVEYIIVDGNSKDSTIDIVKSYGDRIDVVISEADSGIYDAMNKGIRIATGNVICFLNSDDLYYSNQVVSAVMEKFQTQVVDVCYGDLFYVGQHDVNKVVRYWKSQHFDRSLFLKGWSPAHPTFFARAACFSMYGSFNLDYKIAADFELMFRFLYLNDCAVSYVPIPMVRMRLGGATNRSLSNIVKQNLEIKSVFNNNNVHMPKLYFFSKFLNRACQYFSARKFL